MRRAHPTAIVHLVIPVLAALLLGACAMDTPASEQGGLRITEPAMDARLGSSAVRVAGVVERDGVREVVVAGETVPVVAGEFQTTLVLGEGPQHVEVHAEGGLTDAVDVFVDLSGPVVHIESPAPGAFVEGDTLRLTGWIEVDADSEVTARANGEPIDLDADNRFDISLAVGPGAHRVRVTAEDDVGHDGSAFTTALVGTFAPADALVEDAIGLGLGEAALEAMGDGAAREITEERINGALVAMNPVMEGWWGALDVTGESHGGVSLAIEPGPDSLSITGAVTSLSLPFEAHIVGGITIRGRATVAQARIGGTAFVGARDGAPVVDLTDTTVELDGLLIDVTGLWDWIDRNVVTAALRGRIIEGIRSAIEENVPTALAAALDGLAAGREIDVQGHRARITGELADLRASELGLHAIVDLGVAPLDRTSAAAEAAPGPIVFGSAMPPARPYTGIDGSLSADLVNATMFAAWSTGGLAHSFDTLPGPGGAPVDVALVSLLVPAPEIDRRATIGVDVEAALPPVVRVDGDQVAVEIADLRVDIRANDGADSLVARLSIGGRAELRPYVEDGAFAFEIGEVEVTVDELTGVRGLPPPEQLDDIIGELLRPMLEQYATIGGLYVPSFYGFTLTPEELGADNGRIALRAQLTLAP